MSSLESAPRDGSVFEALFDGEWLRVYWSERANDGSPYGTEGFAHEEDGYHLVEDDLEAWRRVPDRELRYGEPSPLSGHRLKQPIIVLGLSFGDEAKGSTVDYLSWAIPDAAAVVRWSGGANAAHNVRHGDRHHTFRQFGSGTFLGLPTFLDAEVVVNLEALMGEAVELESKGIHDPLSLITVNGSARITTPIHVALNRAREVLRGSARHGSTGLGIGETIVQSYADQHSVEEGEFVGNFEISGPTFGGDGFLSAAKLLRASKANRTAQIETILEHQAAYAQELIESAKKFMPSLASELDYGSIPEIAEELLSIASSIEILEGSEFEAELLRTMELGTVIFEGSQGVLLDESWGFHPHTTWARTQPSGLIEWLYENGHTPYVLGLLRSYTTRHGAGPFPSHESFPLSEDELPADDNSWGRWQGDFRVSALDLPLLNYARVVLERNGVQLDGFSLSHLDALSLQETGALPSIWSYGGELDSAERWNFRMELEGPFATLDSDLFLEERILGKPTMYKYLNEETLLEEVAGRLYAKPVLLARGPKRTDRELVAVPENGN